MFLQEREGTFLSRLSIETPGKAETVIAGLYRDIERRISASPPGLCPVDMSLSFLRLCHAQTCGKCVPCRIGTVLLYDPVQGGLSAGCAAADCLRRRRCRQSH